MTAFFKMVIYLLHFTHHVYVSLLGERKRAGEWSSGSIFALALGHVFEGVCSRGNVFEVNLFEGRVFDDHSVRGANCSRNNMFEGQFVRETICSRNNLFESTKFEVRGVGKI